MGHKSFSFRHIVFWTSGWHILSAAKMVIRQSLFLNALSSDPFLTGNIFGVEISCGWHADDMRARLLVRFHWRTTYVICTSSSRADDKRQQLCIKPTGFLATFFFLFDYIAKQLSNLYDLHLIFDANWQWTIGPHFISECSKTLWYWISCCQLSLRNVIFWTHFFQKFRERGRVTREFVLQELPQHPAVGALASDRSVNSFIMVVYEIFFKNSDRPF